MEKKMLTENQGKEKLTSKVEKLNKKNERLETTI